MTLLTVAAHEWRLQRRDLSALIVMTLLPVALIAFMLPTYQQATGGRGAEQAVPGMAVMFAMFLMAHVGLVYFRDHGWGVWSRYLATAVPVWALVAGKAVVPFVMILVQLGVLLLIGYLAFGLVVTGSVLAVVAVAVAFALSLVALAMLVVAVSPSMVTLTVATNLLTMVFAGLGGALTPVELLPDWARPAAPYVPSYWAVQGLRDTVGGGAGLAEVVAPVGVLCAFAAGFMLLAALLFRPAQRKAAWA